MGINGINIFRQYYISVVGTMATKINHNIVQCKYYHVLMIVVGFWYLIIDINFLLIFFYVSNKKKTQVVY